MLSFSSQDSYLAVSYKQVVQEGQVYYAAHLKVYEFSSQRTEEWQFNFDQNLQTKQESEEYQIL